MPGGCGQFILNPNTAQEKIIPSKTSDVLIGEGDVISIRTAGGGGFSSPMERDPARVAYDALLGKVSYREARERYRVVLTEEGVVDRIATSALRRQDK
jgi:N-methylhydantoinase B